MTYPAQSAGPEELLRKKKEFLFPCVYHFYAHPMQLVRGEGVFLFDSEGKRYLDCYCGVSTSALGHSHPELLAAAQHQMASLVHTTTIYLTQPMLDLAEMLAGIAPGEIRRSFFCASGSEAVETALLLAELHTQKPGFIALGGGLHGRTKLGMSVTGLEMWRTTPFPVETVWHAPQPHCYRCPLGKAYPGCDLACANAIEPLIENEARGQIAALILEPIQGNGGIIVPPEGYLQRVREIADLHQVLLIFDEIQTAFGRTGDLFACQHEGVIADILCLSKSLGNGFPIAAVMTTDAIANSYARPGASTYGGNLVAASVAIAVQRILERDHLVERSRRLGEFLSSGFTSLKEGCPAIGSVRGRGLMWGLEVVREDGAPDGPTADRILEAMKDMGVLIGKTGPGRNVLTIMPPLVIGQAHLEELLACLERALQSVA